MPAPPFVRHDGQWFNVYCFAEAADAEKFMARFGGEKFDPRQRGKGSNWMRWKKCGVGQTHSRAYFADRSISMQIRVLVHEAEEGGFWAEVPTIPGCATQGETMDELMSNLQEAIEGCLL